MFLAAAPYFASRFASSPSLSRTFQASELSISSLLNLLTILILQNLQRNASYPRRIIVSLFMNILGFSLLSISTKAFLDASAGVYFVFLMVIVGLASSAAGFMQNGAFAYAAGLGRREYVQGIMAGQGVAGIVPVVVQIASVLSTGGSGAGDDDGGEEKDGLSDSALAYFLTATLVSAGSLGAFFWLMRRHRSVKTPGTRLATDTTFTDEEHDTADDTLTADPEDNITTHQPGPNHTKVPFLTLLRVLFYPSLAIFIDFGITMFFPVFTASIISTSPASDPSTPGILRPAAFIPLAFLVWNTGDLLGRLVPLIPGISLAEKPGWLVLLSIARAGFVPLYYLCNLQHSGGGEAVTFAARAVEALATVAAPSGAGNTVKGDLFYLLVVQLPFGLSNGYIGACCMMAATSEKYVKEHEREAAGSWMGLCLVLGLTVGSLLSFLVTT